MQRSLGILSLALTLFTAGALAPTQPVHADDWPSVLKLPDGWLPEGIVVGDGNILYAGSRRNGAIYAIDLVTGTGRVLYEGRSGGLATGLKYDQRTGYIFASGASNGDLNVIDSRTGNRVANYKLAQTSGPTFINDVILTPNAAFLTDSMRPVLYKVPLGVDGQLSTQDDVVVLPLSGDYTHQTGFNLNGIEATANGDRLIAVQTGTGKLFLVDPNTGVTKNIEVPASVNGDGLLLVDRTLYAVRNGGPAPNTVLKIELAPDVLSGRVVDTLTHSGFDSPTTMAMAGNKLYFVNGRFNAGMAPTVTYTVVSIDQVNTMDDR